MKILTVVGARPQFIKAAVVSRELRKKHTEVLVHTGQHYDYNMSDIFFEELDIPKPDYNLGISGGSHGQMTGQMLIKIEEVLQAEKPDIVLLYGDTNSTMAGALAAVKLQIPAVHVESGNRLGTKTNPEEVNRIVTDHVSSLHLCCTESAKRFLEKEGICDSAFVVGDPMYDAFLYYSEKVGDEQGEQLIDLYGNELTLPDHYYYMTCHREENAGSDEPLIEILGAMNTLDYATIYPVHPRNTERVKRIVKEYGFTKILCCKPVGYLMSVYLVNHCEKIVTDSGGLQREAFFAKKQCVTVFDYVVWPETMKDNRNQLAKHEKTDILAKLSKEQILKSDNSFGDGFSYKKIVNKIMELKRSN
ncbi:UDP-N-acetylglucosamine 2-epimerase [Lachnospiraceae bacterium MD308]|nr:UDP-N-acetylglucosamine 2-epimerase [Lachnospiraceae bacterium MD308]MCI8504498.1 UDP-N-acetylglucosamine 2-epimerase (non-hydrolyzing) [Dorea sp.]